MTNLYSYYAQILLLSSIVINHLTEIYLTRRQLAFFKAHADLPPAEFSSHISVEDHRKAISYSSSKLKVSQMHLLYDAALLMYWFPFRGAERLYQALSFEGLHREVFFIIAFSLIQFALNLPWSIYSTFVLEERFGFNQSTPKLFALDRLKGLILGAAFGLPLLYLIMYLYQSLGSWWWLVSFALLTFFQFFLISIYPTFIAPLFNKFKPLEGEELKSGIERLVTSAGFNAREVFVMDASRRSSHGNAYFTGFGKNKRVVFFDTLLKQLNPSEIMAILAHELGHMKLKHIPKSMATSILMMFIGFWLMSQVAQQEWFYHGHFLKVTGPGALILIFTQAIPLYTFWFSPFSSWVSRKREFEADAYAAHETDAKDLVNGLLKLYQQNASPVVTDKIYSTFYHSHPPALERIRHLDLLKGQSSQ